jgi:hypothetical protein
LRVGLNDLEQINIVTVQEVYTYISPPCHGRHDHWHPLPRRQLERQPKRPFAVVWVLDISINYNRPTMPVRQAKRLPEQGWMTVMTGRGN